MARFFIMHNLTMDSTVSQSAFVVFPLALSLFTHNPNFLGSIPAPNKIFSRFLMTLIDQQSSQYKCLGFIPVGIVRVQISRRESNHFQRYLMTSSDMQSSQSKGHELDFHRNRWNFFDDILSDEASNLVSLHQIR